MAFELYKQKDIKRFRQRRSEFNNSKVRLGTRASIRDSKSSTGLMQQEMNEYLYSETKPETKDPVETTMSWASFIEENRSKTLKDTTKKIPQPKEKPKPFSESSPVTSTSNITDFIANEEGFKAKAYWDEKQWTNGYGTKAKSKDEVITEEEARKRLNEQVSTSKQAVLNMAQKHNYNLTKAQEDALASWAYNLGVNKLKDLTDNGSRGIEEISDAMLEYVYSGGKKRKGLVERRKREYQLFNMGWGDVE